MAFANLPVLFLLSCRNNPLTFITGIPYQQFRSLHRWVGYLVVTQVLAHFSLFTAQVTT
jgi:Ferric reductase like transmembrane component